MRSKHSLNWTKVGLKVMFHVIIKQTINNV